MITLFTFWGYILGAFCAMMNSAWECREYMEEENKQLHVPTAIITIVVLGAMSWFGVLLQLVVCKLESARLRKEKRRGWRG